MTPAQAYFDQTQTGESRWWSWIVGFWFTIIVWVIGQSVLTAPIPDMAATIDPELGEEFSRASLAHFENLNMNKFMGFSGGLVISVIFGSIFWLVNRNTKNKTQTAFGVLTGIMIALSAIFAFLIAPMMGSDDLNTLMQKMMGVNVQSYMLMLLTFPALLIGLYLVQKFIHKRTLLSLHSAARKFRWHRLLQAMGITFIIYAASSLIGHFTGLSELGFAFDKTRFFQFALVSLLFIPLQSATEEIMLRGYLNQGLVSVFKNRWFAYVLTSLLFMALHLSNPEATKAAGDNSLVYYMTISHYFLFGFLMCLVIEIDGGLEAAIGIHAANNLFAAIFVNYENSALPTPSVFLAKLNPVMDLPMGMATLGLVCFLIYKTRKPIEPYAQL